MMNKLQRHPHDEHHKNIKDRVASILQEAIPTQHATDSTSPAPGVQLVGHRNTIHIALHACSPSEVRKRSQLSRFIDLIGRLALFLGVVFAGFYGCSIALSMLAGA